MKILRTVSFALLCCASVVWAQAPLAHAAGSPVLTTEEKSQIEAVMHKFEDAWASRDMVAFRALLTQDCDWVNIVGMHWNGRDEVTEMHRVLLDGRYKGVNLHTLSLEESEIAPGVALVVQKTQLDDFTTPDGHVVKGLQNTGMTVLVKHDGKWLIRAQENSSIDPRASMKSPAK